MATNIWAVARTFKTQRNSRRDIKSKSNPHCTFFLGWARVLEWVRLGRIEALGFGEVMLLG